MIMDVSFGNDVATKKCIINGEEVLAKFQKYTTYAINKDVIDYHLQFKTGVHYPMGTYVDIPDDTGALNTWLIVGRDEDPQFVKYSILKCNWTFYWIHDNKILSCLGALINGASADVSSDGLASVPESKSQFWVPTNTDTQTISYDMRFLITENKINPLAHKVVGIKDTFPTGIIKVTLSQDQYNPNLDKLDVDYNGVKIMVADYNKSAISPTIPATKPATEGTSRITYNGSKPTLVIGGSARVLTATFYDESNNEIAVEPMWDVAHLSQNSFPNEIIEGQLHIKAAKDYTLVKQVVTISVADAEGNCASTIDLEVVAR